MRHTDADGRDDLAAPPGHQVEEAQLLLLVEGLFENLRVLAVCRAALGRVLFWGEDDNRVR